MFFGLRTNVSVDSQEDLHTISIKATLIAKKPQLICAAENQASLEWNFKHLLYCKTRGKNKEEKAQERWVKNVTKWLKCEGLDNLESHMRS